MGAWVTRAAEGHTDAEGRAEMGGAGAVEVEEAAPLLATIVKAACLTGLVPTPAMCRVALRLDHGARAVAWSNAPPLKGKRQAKCCACSGRTPDSSGRLLTRRR